MLNPAVTLQAADEFHVFHQRDGAEAVHALARLSAEFTAEIEAREKRKQDELAPYIEKAFTRKKWMQELTDDDIPTYPAYGAMVAQIDPSTLDDTARLRMERWTKMREVLAAMEEKQKAGVS